ncbi:hypothetical protein MJO28_016520 [Puccinia striiformis f. sp. tritici]|uniref:Uncharacterized protein n=1 Tax=Puccinia striiformis f. sp. tritici TaxID=168172 RepID=A0ACC0DQ12_9BASI|nr:hypothetical protein MJO29_016119 [Puccinia striiformis f. sp. tritici]KAI7935649.1 hypothetical protein MJO28_016520 [Puccinia striiformis f. sp. tritici]
MKNNSQPKKVDEPTNLPAGTKKPNPKSKVKKEKDEDDDASTRHVWTTAQQVTILEEIVNGHATRHGTNNGNLKKEGWTTLVKKMLAKHGFSPTASQIKNQKQFLCRTFLDVKFLRNQSGFGWDEDRSVVTAGDNVWQELLGAHPH